MTSGNKTASTLLAVGTRDPRPPLAVPRLLLKPGDPVHQRHSARLEAGQRLRLKVKPGWFGRLAEEEDDPRATHGGAGEATRGEGAGQ